jgi:hypothetical protein
MQHYETELRNMIAQIGKAEDIGAVWKGKYCELEIMVNHIEALRSNFRINKLCSVQDKNNEYLEMDRTVEYKAEKEDGCE